MRFNYTISIKIYHALDLRQFIYFRISAQFIMLLFFSKRGIGNYNQKIIIYKPERATKICYAYFFNLFYVTFFYLILFYIIFYVKLMIVVFV